MRDRLSLCWSKSITKSRNCSSSGFSLVRFISCKSQNGYLNSCFHESSLDWPLISHEVRLWTRSSGLEWCFTRIPHPLHFHFSDSLEIRSFQQRKNVQFLRSQLFVFKRNIRGNLFAWVSAVFRCTLKQMEQRFRPAEAVASIENQPRFYIFCMCMRMKSRRCRDAILHVWSDNQLDALQGNGG